MEGLDGSGKTTVVEAIAENRKDAIITREPTDMWTGDQLRRCLQDDSLDPLVDLHFFMADRVNHIEETVKPLDERGFLVVSDRYADSTRAYQPVALSDSERFKSQRHAKYHIENMMAPWLIEPDKTLYIDVPVEVAIARSDAEEKYETVEFLSSVKENYDALIAANPERFVVIDGEQSREAVAAEALEKL